MSRSEFTRGLAGFQRPSFEALIPKIVPPEYLSAVASLNALRFEIGFIIAPILGGVLIERFGAAYAYALDAATFTASLIAVFMISGAVIPAGAEKAGLRSIIAGFQVCCETTGAFGNLRRGYERDVFWNAESTVSGIGCHT